MEAAIDWILTNQQISEILLGAALWRHIGSQKWRCTQGSPYDVTQQAPWWPPCGVRRVIPKTLTTLLKNTPNNQICLEQFYMGSQCHDLPPFKKHVCIHLLFIFFFFNGNNTNVCQPSYLLHINKPLQWQQVKHIVAAGVFMEREVGV